MEPGPPAETKPAHMTNALQVECRVVVSADAGAPARPSVLSLPSGPCAVIREPAGGLRLVPEPWLVPADALRIEPVRQRGHPLRLLAVADAPGALRVNGQAAPRVAVLRENDVVEWGPRVSFVVEFARRPTVGLPPPADVGRVCPVCRVPFSADVLTYGCACGTRLHCEASEDGLQCAQRRRTCPTCHQPVALGVIGAALPN